MPCRRIRPVAEQGFDGSGAGRPVLEAEPEHQDYLERYPNGYTCHFVRPNWVLPKRLAAQ